MNHWLWNKNISAHKYELSEEIRYAVVTFFRKVGLRYEMIHGSAGEGKKMQNI